ncbi:MAG: hypothetical protein RIS70_2233 [Planctomycetota bacterium]
MNGEPHCVRALDAIGVDLQSHGCDIPIDEPQRTAICSDARSTHTLEAIRSIVDLLWHGKPCLSTDRKGFVMSQVFFKSSLAFAILLTCTIASCTGNSNESELQRAIRAAAPEAASIRQADWTKLTSGTQVPRASDVDNQSLGILILTLRIPEEVTPEQKSQFRTVAAIPKPTDFARALQPSRSSIVTPLQTSYIKTIEATADGNQATGRIAFDAPGVYAGEVEFTATKQSGKWVIVEFRLPAWDATTTRNEAGIWKIQEPNN